jgi:hypothetical protein
MSSIPSPLAPLPHITKVSGLCGLHFETFVKSNGLLFDEWDSSHLLIFIELFGPTLDTPTRHYKTICLLCKKSKPIMKKFLYSGNGSNLINLYRLYQSTVSALRSNSDPTDLKNLSIRAMAFHADLMDFHREQLGKRTVS